MHYSPKYYYLIKIDQKIKMHSKFNLIFSSIILAMIAEISFNVTAQQVALLHSTAMLQTSNYGDYEPYVNSKLKIKLEYPSDWKRLVFDTPALSNLKGFVSFEPLEAEQALQANSVEETPVISIIAERLKYKNITIDEFAKLQSDNIQELFSDFDFKFENKTAVTLGNNTAMKIVYTIVDPYNHDNLRIRNGMEIWTIRADTIFTLSYLGERGQYFKYLPEVQKIIDSFKFIG
jgi:hypothetical protein